MSRQGTQVTLTIPDGAPPGTLLSVPVRGGTESIKVRVPDGLGAGSTVVLIQPDDSEEWSMQVKTVVPLQPEEQYAGQTGVEVGSNGYETYAGATGPGDYQEQGQLAPYQPPDPQPTAGLDAHVAYTVRLDTTVGAIDIIVRPDWAPHGTRRFLDLAHAGDFSELAFYRAIKGCIVQFGLPAKRPWPPIPDDPPTGVPFLLGAVSFAAIGENTRRSTLFICIGDMSHMLGQKSWETPIGAVAESSLDVLEGIDTSYGDIAEFGGCGPDTSRINCEGNGYLQANFPNLSYIRAAWPLDWLPEQDASPSLIPPAPAPAGSSFQPPPAAPPVDNNDQVAIAAQAAREASLQAQQAAEAAQLAAQAQEVAAAAQAAQVAQQAARAATLAAEKAQAAQQAQLAQAAKATQFAQEGVDRLSLSKAPTTRPAVAETAPVVRSAPPMYPGSTDLISGGSTNWTQSGLEIMEPVDVPVEVRPKIRSSRESHTTAIIPASVPPRASSFAKISHLPPHMSATSATTMTPLGHSVRFASHPAVVHSSVSMQVPQVVAGVGMAQRPGTMVSPMGFSPLASPLPGVTPVQLPLR